MTSVVRRVHASLLFARAGESVLLGAASALSVAAAAVAGGRAPLERDVVLLAFLTALACALAWALEHRLRAEDVARKIDRRLRHQGGLVTAYELEGRAADSDMAKLVRERVLRRLRFAEALRALFPSLFLPVAAPLVGAFCLVLAVESARRPESAAVDLAGLGEGLSGHLAGLAADVLEAGEDGALDPSEVAALLAVRNEALALAGKLAAGASEPELAEQLEQLDRDIADLAPTLAARPELDRSLGDARTWADAARMELERRRPGGGDGVTGSDAPAVPGADAAQAAPVAPALVGDAANGTMAGSPSEAPGLTDGRGAATEGARQTGGRPETGTTAGVHWPRQHDAVVRLWVEARRRAMEVRD